MRIRILLLGALLIGALACAGGHDPVAPQSAPLQPSQPQAQLYAGAGHVLLGAWVLDVLADHTRIEVIPLRVGAGHFNVRTFMEDGPCTDCLKMVRVTPQGGGVVDCDIQIRHPFVGLDNFTGFDVCGTVIFPATGTWPASGSTWSRADEGGAELLNPDGWTTLFNPVDFEQGPGDPDIFTYQKGSFATPLDGASTLNPYRAFYLEPDRRPFYTSNVITRTYSIKLRAGPFRFGYVVDASWAKPDPSPPVNVPDDFPITANCLEAYKISAHVEEGLTETWGSAVCEIDVYDWQRTETVSVVSVEAPDLFEGTVIASLEVDFGMISRWTVVIGNPLGALEGDYPVLVRVDDVSEDPFLGPLSAYQVIYAHVDPASPYPPGVYVDRDYPGSGGGMPENGTPEAPFNTINEGVIAAQPGDKIYIDPSPEPYNEQVYLQSERYLLGDNWRDDGDSGQPVIEAADRDVSVYGKGIGDLTLDNLEIRPGGDLWAGFLFGILFDYKDNLEHTQDVTVRNCTFTGDRVHTGNDYGDEVICCEANLIDNFVFEDNVITDVHVGSDQGGYFGGLHCDVCDGVTIRRNRIYNCTTKNSFLGMHVWNSAAPVLIEDNEVGPLTNSDTPFGWTLGWAINVISYSDVTVRHNVVHDLGEPGHRVDTVGLFLRSVGTGIETNWQIENNLIYNLYAQDPDNTSNTAGCRGIMFRMNSGNDLDGLRIANNTIVGLTSGNYVTGLLFDIGSGNTLYNYAIENNIVKDVTGPAEPDDWETSAAVYAYWPGDDLLIEYTLFDNIVIPDPMFYGVTEGAGIVFDQDPMFLPDYRLPIDSSAQLGNPFFIDFDDPGPPSGDPDDPNPDTRSRMGAFGGPGGDW